MIFYFVPRMIAAAISILVLIVLTRLLSPESFGLFNMLVLASFFGYSLAFSWLASSTTRFHNANEFGGMAAAYMLGVGALLALISVPVIVASLLVFPMNISAMILVGTAFCIAHSAHEIGTSGLRVLGAKRQFAVATLLRPLIGVSLALVLVRAGQGYLGALTGMMLGAAIPAIYAIRLVVAQTGIALPDRRELQGLLKFGMPLAIVMSATSLHLLMAQSLLASLQGMALVGFFAAAQTLTMRTIRMPMDNLSRSVGASVFQAFEANGESEARRILHRHFSMLMLVALPVTLVLMFANDTIADLLFNDEFAPKVAVTMPILAFASFLLGVQGAYYSYAFTLSKRTFVQLWIVVFSLIFHFAVSWASIVMFGDIGAPIGFLINAIFILAVSIVVGQRLYIVDLPKNELGKAVIGMVVFIPFAILADSVSSVVGSLAILLLGLIGFVSVLAGMKQQGAVAIFNRARRLIK